MDDFKDTNRFDNFRAVGGESPALTRFSQRPVPTMNTLQWLKPGSKAGICQHEWPQAEPLSPAEGGTVTALKAQRFLLKAKFDLEVPGKVMGSRKIRIY